MKTDRKVGEREGERHAVKVVMNGTRTRDTLSGRSILCGMMPGPVGQLAGAPIFQLLKHNTMLIEHQTGVPAQNGLKSRTE